MENCTSILSAAQTLLALNLRPIPLKARSKIPSISDWQNFHPTELELPGYFQEGLNLGCLMGRISGDIVSVDLDWEEAGKLAPHLLPESWTVLRGTQVRHVMLKSSGAKTAHFDAPQGLGGKRRIVEILAEGRQVMLPPSVHPEGQPLGWLNPLDKTKCTAITPDTLLESVRHIAGAALLLRLWDDLEGSRHDIMLALTGSLYHAQWSSKRIKAVLSALLTAAADTEKRDRVKAVTDTLAAAKAGRPVTGLPKLAEYLPAEVIHCLKTWWDLGHSPPTFLLNGQPFTFEAPNEAVEEAHGATEPSPPKTRLQSCSHSPRTTPATRNGSSPRPSIYPKRYWTTPHCFGRKLKRGSAYCPG